MKHFPVIISNELSTIHLLCSHEHNVLKKKKDQIGRAGCNVRGDRIECTCTGETETWEDELVSWQQTDRAWMTDSAAMLTCYVTLFVL